MLTWFSGSGVGVIGRGAGDIFVSSVYIFGVGTFEPIFPVFFFDFLDSVTEFVGCYLMLGMNWVIRESMNSVG